MVSVETPQAPAPAPARSVRRATARRASSRRAFARSRRRDDDTGIVDFLTGHPGSTTGDLARGLNLQPDHVAACLAQLMRSEEIHRTSHGFAVTVPAAGPGPDLV